MQQPLAGLYIEEPAPFRLGGTVTLALDRGRFEPGVQVRCDALIVSGVTEASGPLPLVLRTAPARTTWLTLAILEREPSRLVVQLPDEPPEVLGGACEPVAFVFIVEGERAALRCRIAQGPGAFIVSSFDPDESVVMAGPAGG